MQSKAKLENQKRQKNWSESLEIEEKQGKKCLSTPPPAEKDELFSVGTPWFTVCYEGHPEKLMCVIHQVKIFYQH